VTAQLPYGVGEPFIVAEIEELVRQGCDVVVVPVRPQGKIVHGDAHDLLPRAMSSPLVSGAILRSALAEVLRAPAPVMRALVSLLRSRTPHILLKNLAVFPKALWLARYARRRGADHIHAHWAGTSATLAMLASQISGVSWSLTAHRWDIAEDNLLGLKARRACFVRAISAHGAEELARIVGEPSCAPWVLPMGVRLAARPASFPPEPPLRILTAARFVEKKGHIYLVDAVSRLKERGVSVRVELAGDGPLASSLQLQVQRLALQDEIVFRGGLPHEELLHEMSGGRWHVAVLPSVVTSSGELEGIPVSLIEAMACGLPTIASESGGIPELLGDDAGVLVPPGDAEALAEALERVAADRDLRVTLAERGRKRVEETFAIERIAAALHVRFRECAARPS
jgi:colanic acid/amylovoran biosynthesis glycosyltransferase